MTEYQPTLTEIERLPFQNFFKQALRQILEIPHRKYLGWFIWLVS